MELYPALPRPKPSGRPWLMLNMIASADGAIAVDGTSEALGNPADEAVFSAVRACADWIVAAAGTVRAERYGLPRPGAAARRARRSAGRAERPRLAVVSSSLDLDPDLPLFADQRAGDELPVILTEQRRRGRGGRPARACTPKSCDWPRCGPSRRRSSPNSTAAAPQSCCRRAARPSTPSSPMPG